jgi:hypothetical protein
MLRLMSEFFKYQTYRMTHLDGEEGESLLLQHEGIATVLLWTGPVGKCDLGVAFLE